MDPRPLSYWWKRAVVWTIAGFALGWTDMISMRVMDIVLSFPALILAIAIVTLIGSGLLNAVASVAVIAVLGANQSVLAPTRRRLGDAAGVAVLVTIVLFLPGLTLVGMEHVVHMALVLAAVVLFHRQGLGELGRWPRWLPYVLLALATLARLETVFLAAGRPASPSPPSWRW